MVVDEAVIDLVREVVVDHGADNSEAVVLTEDGRHLEEREERRVALGHQVVYEGQALTGPNDGEGQKGAKEEGGHAGECDVSRMSPRF